MPEAFSTWKSLRNLAGDFAAYARGSALRLLGMMLVVAALEGAGLSMLAPLIALTGIRSHAATLGSLSLLTRLDIHPTLMMVLCVYIVLIVVHSAVSWRRDLLSSALQHGFVDHLRNRLFTGIGGARWEFLAQTNSAEFSHALTTDINRLNSGIQAILQIVTIGLIALAYAATAVRLAPLIASLSLAAVTCILSILRSRRKHATQLGSALTQTTQRAHAEIFEFLAGLKIAKSCNAEARLAHSFAERLRDSGRALQQFTGKQASGRAAWRIGGAVVLCGFVYLATTVAALPAPALLALVIVLVRLFSQLSELQHWYEKLLHALPAYDSFSALYGRCVAAGEAGAGDAVYTLTDTLRFECVTYRPLNGPEDLVVELDIIIPARLTTALVGQSGAGKSTLADLMTGLTAPTSGRILIDGVEMEHRRAWRECVAYVPQDVFLFNSSLRDNMLWAVRSASDADIWQALSQAAAAQFVAGLPHGLDTLLGERGIRLSGGERQRLAIARALLRKPQLLLLDEATSALDRDTESRIQATLAALHGHLTVVVIAHSEATLRAADRTIQLADRRVAVPAAPVMLDDALTAS
jgi:ATP-binding cassette subfamily C protein